MGKTSMFKTLKRKVKNTSFGKSLLVAKYKIKYPGSGVEYRDGKYLNQDIATVLEEKVKEKVCTPKEAEKLRDDMIYCHLLYHATPVEYFSLSYNKKNRKQREGILTSIGKDLICIESMGGSHNFYQLQDKIGLYNILKEYYHRECMLLNSKTAFETFEKFVNKHGEFIIKPLKGHHGDKTTILRNVDNVKALYDELTKDGSDWIVEQTIKQTDFMSKWNPESVNTVRLPLIYNHGKFTVFHPIFRMGRKGYCIDNGGGGGIGAAIDGETGKIISDGSDAKGNTYTVHPDSGITIKGAQIPYWNELLEKAKEIQKKLEGHKYVAWDFALTDNGWVVIEGNWGEIQHYQRVTGLGVYKEFKHLMLDE